MCEQSEFWHWEHLGCWQSWSHLSLSQNSNFGFWALLMMIKKPPVCGLGCWQGCGAGGEDGAAKSRDGPEGGVPPRLCPLPWSKGHCVLCPWALVGCPHSITGVSLGSPECPHFAAISVAHARVRGNEELYISDIEPNFQDEKRLLEQS